eukprot:2261458-Pyramimonas_sp.AAC.1
MCATARLPLRRFPAGAPTPAGLRRARNYWIFGRADGPTALVPVASPVAPPNINSDGGLCAHHLALWCTHMRCGARGIVVSTGDMVYTQSLWCTGHCGVHRRCGTHGCRG